MSSASQHLLDGLNFATSSHISLSLVSLNTLLGLLLGLQLQLQLQLQLPALCFTALLRSPGVWPGLCRLTRPPAWLACLPIHLLNPPNVGAAPGPRIHQAHQAPPSSPTSICRSPNLGRQCSVIARALLSSHLRLAPLQSSAPRPGRTHVSHALCNDQLPARLPVRVWSSNSHAAVITSVMATPSTGAIPPPKQIRFVNNQGQPPSKRRRVNAASVHLPHTYITLLPPLYIASSVPQPVRQCVTGGMATASGAATGTAAAACSKRGCPAG